MTWMVGERKEIVRNLPLEVYGLADTVATKPIELCHNLASNLTIDMFCSGGKRSTTTKQKACRTKDGKLAVETLEVYGDLENIQDVLLAWNTLSSIWQKIFPEWPAAQIALRVIFKMKMFQHCGNEAKDVMVSFSNRFLTSSSQRAASKKGPLSYERAKSLAGNVCADLGHAKEPSATKVKVVQEQERAGAGGLCGGGCGEQRGGDRGGGRGRGGRGGVKGTYTESWSKRGLRIRNEELCVFYQNGNCMSRKSDSCKRGSKGSLKHVCAWIKVNGEVCGGKHTKSEHDATKHGN
jgi:hypothetical protein